MLDRGDEQTGTLETTPTSNLRAARKPESRPGFRDIIHFALIHSVSYSFGATAFADIQGFLTFIHVVSLLFYIRLIVLYTIGNSIFLFDFLIKVP